jgi:hypothetical protein
MDMKRLTRLKVKTVEASTNYNYSKVTIMYKMKTYTKIIFQKQNSPASMKPIQNPVPLPPKKKKKKNPNQKQQKRPKKTSNYDNYDNCSLFGSSFYDD